VSVPISPKVSVIIPTYNRRQYLECALESVFAQTVPPDEIIVVDDGSKDGTDELIRNLSSKKYPQLVYIWQENKGAGSARNQGIRAARNPIVAFLDSDDTWYPYHIKEALDCFSVFPEAGFVLAKYKIVDLQGTANKNYIVKKYKRRDFAKKIALRISGSNYLLDTDKCLHHILLSNIGFLTSTLVINRERCPRKVFFDEMLSIGEDVDFYLQLMAYNISLIYIDTIHSKYCFHTSNSITTAMDNSMNRLQKAHLIIRQIEKKLVYCRSEMEYEAVFRELSRFYWAIADGLHEEGKYSEANKWYRLSFKLERRFATFKHCLAYRLCNKKYYGKLCRTVRCFKKKVCHLRK